MVVLENTSVSIIEESGLKGSHRIMFHAIYTKLLATCFYQYCFSCWSELSCRFNLKLFATKSTVY